MNFGQIKTGNKNYTLIDDSIIEKIACVKAFDNTEMNNKLHQHHKDLLKHAKNKNGHKEVGFFWNLNDVNAPCLTIRGRLNGFNISDDIAVSNLVKNTNSIMSVVVMHNHPRNGEFSREDINSFTDFNSIYLMTAVCNDGTIYMLRKERNFNPFLLQKYYNDGVAISEQEANKERLNKAKKLKLDVNNPEDRKKIAALPTKAYYYGIRNVAKHAKAIGVTYRCSVKRK